MSAIAGQEAIWAWARGQMPSAGGDNAAPVPVVGDASARRYYRCRIAGTSYVLAYAPPASEKNREFVEIHALMSSAGIRVPGIYAVDLEQGYFVLEDLGDTSLLSVLNEESAGGWYRQAFTILRQMARVDTHKLALPEYDASLLRQELGRFDEWFVGELLGHSVSESELGMLERFYRVLIDSALAQPRVLVHRDFHSRNLMCVDDGHLAAIDFQDAVAGPLTYDLVSLLRDCYIAWPPAQVTQWALTYRQQLVDSTLGGLPDEKAFLRDFDLMGLQRHVKVLGTFARLYLRDGKAAYLNDLPLVLRYTRQVLEEYATDSQVFAEVVGWFRDVIDPLLDAQHWITE